MGLFSGLEAFGLKNQNMEVYEKAPNEADELAKKSEEKEVYHEADYLFPKTYKCPICDMTFKSLTVRTGKMRPIGQEDDLRPLYKEFDPVKYEPVVCPNCGYASLARYFDRVMPLQAKRIREEVGDHFTGFEQEEVDSYTYDDAITQYRMVLYCDVVGNVKASRKAYTCLKMAWVLRGKLEHEGADLSEEEYAKIAEDERECIQNAYDGYVLAFSNETFPMSGMDEMTLCYLVAGLAFRLEKYRDSLQLLSRILGNHNAPARIKDKAIDLKEQIRAKIKETQ